MAVPVELGDFAEDVRRILAELGRGLTSLSGGCLPPLDVYERDDVLQVAVDLPGVAAHSVRVLAKGDTLLIVGEKPTAGMRAQSSFHLVERGYGPFVRVLRLGCACDVSRADAMLLGGELRITLPKIPERRGRLIEIRVTSGLSRP
jgi:HSP20 family protein